MPFLMLTRWLPRFRRAYRSLEKLAEREQWSRADLERFQLERLNRLWASARRFVPFYRHLATERNLPPHFDTLQEFLASFPLLTKETVRREGTRMLSEQAEAGRWETTSGSTGSPTRAFWGRRAWQNSLQGKYRYYAQWDIDIFDPMVFVWGQHLPTEAHAWRRAWKRVERWSTDRMRNRLRLVPDVVTEAMLQSHLEKIAAFRPSLIYSYTTIMFLLAQNVSRGAFSCPTLRIVNYTAEPGLPRMVRAMEASFGVPAVGEYGSSECGFIAGEGPDRLLRVREDKVLLETLPREDGRYDIVVTPLTNPSFPLLRYQLGDVTDAPLTKPATGMAVLSNVAGRCNDLLALGGGRFLAADGFEHLFDDCRFVRRYRVHQHKAGSCTAWLELHGQVKPSEISQLKQQLEYLLEGQAVTIEVCSLLPPQPSGKHRWITSDIASPASLTSLEESEMAAVR